MSLSNQNFGFTDGDPVILGKRNVIKFTISDLTAAEVDSAEWVLMDISPVEGTPTALVTKSTSSGIAVADGSSGLEATITLEGSDTSSLSGGDYFHRLDYVHTDGALYEAARGTGRLTPRA